jgi:uncharacterized protein YecE (DUF72 family)
MSRLLIGTSGWTYPSWKGVFYPKDLPSARFLEFFTKKFSTTEVNYSFYHLPKPTTYKKWAAQVPESFMFAVKASRFITHIKRLTDVEEPWRLFLQNAQALGPHLGPILFQFPASFRRDNDRLTEFLKMARTVAPGADRLRMVFEFRHESWFSGDIYRLLSRHGAALCISDSSRYPRRDVMTADFVYFRFHGRNACSHQTIRRRKGGAEVGGGSRRTATLPEMSDCKTSFDMRYPSDCLRKSLISWRRAG